MDKKNITEKIVKYEKFKQFKRYMRFKTLQKNNNSVSPDNNGKKYLVIIACHCDSPLKLETIIKNLRYFEFKNMNKIVINTSGLQYGNSVSNICSMHNNTTYVEIDNSGYYDFGKWLYVLTNLINYDEYDYIIFTNDSFIIHNSINHFFNLTVKHNVELYGYNDSSQCKYHYQSYLFSLRKDAVKIFINRVNNPNLNIKNQADVINNFELDMPNWFTSHKSFLTIGNFGLHKTFNIFFDNDELYVPLKNSGLLPFTKLKRNT